MFEKQRLLFVSLGYCLLLAGSGCSGGPVYELNEDVRGTLTLDGKPLSNVNVQFVPEPAASQPKLQCPLSMSVTNEKGNFEMMCDNGKSGAVIGKQRVVVAPGRDEGSDREDAAGAAASRKTTAIPVQLTIASTSNYFLEVTRDKHDYKVELKSK